LDLKLLETLTQTFGPSGYEDDIRAAILKETETLADEIHVDPLGSLVLHKHGSPGGKRVLLAAHMDEIGLMATHIEEKGYVRFTSIGGLRPIHYVGGRARFHDGTSGTIYVERRDDATTVPSLQHLFIDVGAAQRETCPIRVGDTAVFEGPLYRQGTRLVSKAMDDRIGCYVLIELLRRISTPSCDLYVAFTTQEEITLSGARTSAYRVDPEIAISVDVTTTGDTPKALPMAVSLGAGPGVKVKDGGMIAHASVRELLVNAAQRTNVPYQLEVLLGGTTDAAAMQLVRSGVPSGCLSVPCRYVHSPSEMVDEADVENTVAILLEALTSPLT